MSDDDNIDKMTAAWGCTPEELADPDFREAVRGTFAFQATKLAEAMRELGRAVLRQFGGAG